MKIKALLLATCVILSGQFATAQSSGSYGLPKKKDFDRLSLGLGVGMNWFQGDIEANPNTNSSIWKNIKQPAFQLKVGYQVSHSVQANLRLGYTKLVGEKKSEQIRLPDASTSPQYTYGLKFESPTFEASINANYTFGNISYLQRNKRFHFYGEIGAGLFSFAPKVWSKDFDDTDGIKKKDSVLVDHNGITEGMVTAGLGFKYQFKRFDAGLFIQYHKTLTDKIDWVDKGQSETDNYALIMLNVNYTFGKKQAMMEWVNPMEVVYSDLSDMKDKMDMLSGDKDKDGVSDLFDKDNSTAEGVHVYGDGTTVDTDGDGIPDGKDADPFSAKGVKVDGNGLESDTDGDGVPDSKDLEPNTAKGSLVNFQGVTIAPPGESGSASASASAASWLPSIYFDVDQSGIKSNQNDRLNTVARVMTKNPNLKLTVIGNTDADATDGYNDKLGMKRAEKVKAHLIKVYGIDGSRLITESRGEKEQMAKGLKPMNRRVDFEVAK